MGELVRILTPIVAIAVAIAVALFIAYTKSPASKGASGENSVARIVQKALGKGLYGYVLQNVYIPRQDGGTSEVDVLLISTKGLFVFESKNFAGWVFGDGKHRNWTVSLYAGKNLLGFKQTEKHHFYNPVWQNQSHIKALRYYLGSSAPMYSVIVFSNRGELKSITHIPNEIRVIQTGELSYYMSNVLESFPEAISKNEVDSIHARLVQHTNVVVETKIEHLSNIESRKASASSDKPAIATEKCPWCGGELVVRTAKRGPHPGSQFYGCSNYPSCTFTKNLD